MFKGLRKINKLKLLGTILLILGLFFFAKTYWPVLNSYFNYYFKNNSSGTVRVEMTSKQEEITKEINKDTQTVFVDSNFGLYIPQLKINASVIKDVSPTNESEYLLALEKGIAHAKGTNTPDQSGNVFLFAHSAENFYKQRKYDIYFYLLSELKKGDEILLSYNGVVYKYIVSEVINVPKTELKYLSRYSDKDTLTLMTCFPPGTDWRRTIVISYREEPSSFISF